MNTTPIPSTRRTSSHVIFSRMAQGLESSSQQENICVSQGGHLHVQHAMSHAQSVLFLSCLTSSAHTTRTSNLTPSLFLSHGDDHCDDPQPVATFGPLAEPNSCLQVMSTNDLTEMNDTVATSKFLHRPSMTSTCDSAESIATPLPESDLNWSAITEFAGFTTVFAGEREASADRSRVYHSYRENSASSLLHLPGEMQGDLQQCTLKQKKVASQESRSDREGISLAHRAVRGENGALSRLSES